MQRLLFALIITSLMACSRNTPKNVDYGQEHQIHFYGPDSLKIYGDLYKTNKDANTIVLFHQGGSNARAEYRTIIPELTAMGYNILAVDLFLGGQRYGSFNRTISGVALDNFKNPSSYCDDYDNMVATLQYVKQQGFTGKTIIWGSSYSATLAIKLGSEYTNDVAGVLSFSPAAGPPMQDCQPNAYIEAISVPLIILKPPNEMGSENAKTQFELAAKHGHQAYAAEAGVHGSSMLVPERVNGDVAPNWAVVKAFLETL